MKKPNNNNFGFSVLFSIDIASFIGQIKYFFNIVSCSK